MAMLHHHSRKCATGGIGIRIILLMLLVLYMVSDSSISTRTTTRIAAQDVGKGCTLCVDGSIPNLDGTIGETSCRTIANAIQQTPANTELCTMTQLQGYISCHCPTYPVNSYCSLCSNESTGSNTNNETFYYTPIPQSNRNQIIPDTNFTCGEAEFIPHNGEGNNITGTSTASCPELPNSAADFCGCIGTTQQTCFLCSEDNNDDDTSISSSNSMLHVSRLLPPLFITSCGSLDKSLGVFSTEECSSDSMTYSIFQDMIQMIPLSVQAYCGCSTTSNTTVSLPNVTECNICGGDNNNDNSSRNVSNPNATITIENDDATVEDVTISCHDLDVVARYVTNATYCSFLSTQYQTICCNNNNNNGNDTANLPTITPRTIPPARIPLTLPNNNNNNNNTGVPNSTSNSITTGTTTSRAFTVISTTGRMTIPTTILLLFLFVATIGDVV